MKMAIAKRTLLRGTRPVVEPWMFTIQRFDGGDGPSAESNEPNNKLAQHLARVKARKLLQQQKPHAGPAQPPKETSTNGKLRVSHSAGGAGSAHLQVSPPKSAPKEKKKRKREGSTSAEGVATETPRPAVKTRETETSEQVSVKKRRRPDSSARLGGEAGSRQTLREAPHGYHDEDDAPMGDTPSLDSLRKLFSLPRKLTGVAAPPEASVDDAKSKKKKSKKAKPPEGTDTAAARGDTATGTDEAEARAGTEEPPSTSTTAADFGEVRSPGLMRLRAMFGGNKATSGPRMSIEAAEEPSVSVDVVQDEAEEEGQNDVDMDARVEDDEDNVESGDGEGEAIDEEGEAEVETEGGHEDQASAAEGEDGEVNGGPITSEGVVSGLDHVRKLLNKHLKDTRKRGKVPRAMDDEDEEALAVPDQPEEAQEAERALAMTTREAAKAWGLDRRLVPVLEANGVKGFFAVQCRVVPYLISTEHAELVRDAVVCAPTGSGKTLVYVLALLQGLKERRVLRLRGLVIVPNRDLAIQVMSEFERYAPAVGLKVGLAIGQSDFAKEQKALVGATTSTALMEMDGGPLSSDPGGHSLVDVLVATPGRLMDHLERTLGFTLQHLRYLVLDEVDRLVNQSYQDWAHRVYEAIYGQTPGKFMDPPPPSPAYHIMPATVRIRPFSSKERAILPTLPPPPLRKLLFSATLTANPQKLAMLDLRNPHYCSIGGHGTTASTDAADAPAPVFTLPDTLTEQAIVCEAKEKPLVLLGLLCKVATQGLVLIFTSSVDSTHRLCRLVQLCASTGLRTRMHTTPTGVCEFSSALTQLQRKDLIRRCIARDVRVLVSSDGMARGIDLPNVATVINYDVPTQLKTYVHRVGRTARAGKNGTAVSVLKKGQESQFKKLRTGVKGGEVRSMRRKEVGELTEVVGAYKRALAGLKEVLGREKRGRLKLVDPLPEEVTGTEKAKQVAVQKDEGKDSEDDEEAMLDVDGGEEVDGMEGSDDAEPTESVELRDPDVVRKQSDVGESSSASNQAEEEEGVDNAQDGGMDVESGDDAHDVDDSAMQLELEGLDDFEAVDVSDEEDEGPMSTAEHVRPQPNGTGYPKPVRGRPRDSAVAAGSRGRRGGAGGRYGRGGADGRHGRGGRGTGVTLRGRGVRGRGFVRGYGSGGRSGGRRGGRGRP